MVELGERRFFVARWLERGAVAICIARPVHAVFALVGAVPLTRGVTRRYSLVRSYRRAWEKTAEVVAMALEEPSLSGFVACALGADGCIVDTLLWCGDTPRGSGVVALDPEDDPRKLREGTHRGPPMQEPY
ncbi:MAG: hypothetical protein KC731_02235 [Myxococcales bacterium]|nr:hypothetical protein [Myxococcales bacterium]